MALPRRSGAVHFAREFQAETTVIAHCRGDVLFPRLVVDKARTESYVSSAGKSFGSAFYRWGRF
jgi:hypothetical protein